jgi:hypothetical protein
VGLPMFRRNVLEGAMPAFNKRKDKYYDNSLKF